MLLTGEIEANTAEIERLKKKMARMIWLPPCTFLSLVPPKFFMCFILQNVPIVKSVSSIIYVSIASSSVIRIVKQNQVDRINVYYSLLGWII